MSERVKHASNDTRRLATLQSEAFHYFQHASDGMLPGLIADCTHPQSACSIAAVGFALSAFVVASEIGLISRTEALRRTLLSLRLFAHSEQSEAPDAAGYRGFYYHFLDRSTGRRDNLCEISSIDTALFILGALTAARYFDSDRSEERELRELAENIYRRVEWDWMLADGVALCHGWMPERGFLPGRWTGYSEALLLYLLALGSPTHPIPARSYQEGWAAGHDWRDVLGYPFLYAGPLFIHQMTHCWVDLRGIQDDYMRGKGIDYFENSRRAIYAQQAYAVQNPRGFRGYGPDFWGLTACDGPGPIQLRAADDRILSFYDYIARAIPDGPDDGTIAPCAVIASLPFAPEIVLPTIESLAQSELCHGSLYGFETALNETFPKDADGRQTQWGWVSPYSYGINLGPVVLMIENHRSNLIWRLMRESPWIVAGLHRAGFTGGRLDDLPAASPTT